MKRTIKLSLTLLFILTIFLVLPEKMHRLKVEAAEEIISSDVAIDEIISKIEVYLNEYLKEFPADDLISEKIDPKEHLTKKLEADHFTEEEISKVFDVVAGKRQEELIDLVEIYLEEEPLLSKKALISKLTDNSYSQKEIEQGLESIQVDWKEQAVKASEDYINTEVEMEDESYEIISIMCLRQYLVEEKKFTLKEATYGVEESAIDWEEQAFKQAKYYLAADAYSKIGLINQLISDEFTNEEAIYAVTKTQTNWEEQALKKAEIYLEHSFLPTKEKLENYLKREGFSQTEVDYAVDLLFKDADEEELEVEELNLDAQERPIIIKPLEFITNHIVISAQAATYKSTDSKVFSTKEPSWATTKKPQSTNNENPRVAEIAEVEDEEDEEQTSLFDSPVFAPVIMVLVVGNLYLFQKS